MKLNSEAIEDFKDYIVESMNNVFELWPDAKRIIRCTPKLMFED